MATAPGTFFDLGRQPRPLRDEGVLIVGSGLITRNLPILDWHGAAPTPCSTTATTPPASASRCPHGA